MSTEIKSTNDISQALQDIYQLHTKMGERVEALLEPDIKRRLHDAVRQVSTVRTATQVTDGYVQPLKQLADLLDDISTRVASASGAIESAKYASRSRGEGDNVVLR